MLLDLLLVVIVGASVISGFIAGFARAGFGFFAAIAGILFGFWFYGFPASFYANWFDSPAGANLLGFLTVFFGTVAVGALLGKIGSTVFKWTGLSWIDRILGGAFGLVRGSLVAAAFVAILLAFNPRPTPNWMVGSAVLPYAVGVADLASGLAPRAIKDAFAKSLGEVREAWADQVEKARDRVRNRQSNPERDEP